MTEKEAWLKIGQKCAKSKWVEYLCHETVDAPSHLRAQMLVRLFRFMPHENPSHFSAWWVDGTTRIVNDQRATACCFLAAMCEEEA